MEILELLNSTKEQTLRYFALEPQQLQKTYAPGKWKVKDILHHLTDAETILYDRARRIISEKPQVLWAFDQDAWKVGLNYDELPLELNKPIYESVRNMVIHLFGKYYEQLGQKTFVHNEAGFISLKDVFDKIAKHNVHHLHQIEAALKN